LEQTRIALLKEQAERLKEAAQNVRLNHDLQKVAFVIVAWDRIIKERLNIQMPDSFEQRG